MPLKFMQLCLATGSSRLIGSEIRAHFHERGFVFHGVDQARTADHICHPGNQTKMLAHYSKWKLTRTLRRIFLEIAEARHERMAK